MEVLNDIVGFENRKIYQNKDWFCFSVDSLLLIDFIKIQQKDKKILELGMGNGINLLLLSLKTNRKLEGIELQEDVFAMANKSIIYNGLEKQIITRQLDIRNCTNILNHNFYDIIFSNPPFYETTKYKDIHKQIARSEKEISLEELLKTARILLKDKGSFYMIYKPEKLVKAISFMSKYKFSIKRLKFIYNDNNTNSFLVLIEATKNGKANLIVEKPFFLYNNAEKTKDYKRILGEI